jgi:diphthine-ammonia ligase
MKQVIATWSGGKDSCLAAYKAQQAGYSITYLANTVSKQFKRVGFHGIEASLIQKQAQAIGIPLLQQEVSPEQYWLDFTDNLKKRIEKVDGIVFGDIFLEECFAASKKVCDELGVELIEPLWKKKSEDILEEFIAAEFSAVVVSAQATLLGREWLGRTIDKSFIEDMKKVKDVDLCGENGEFHTFVTSGPLFRQKITIEESSPYLSCGFWFLDIQRYTVS